jgi:hypothetical protein
MKLKEIDTGYKKGIYALAFVYSRDNGNVIIKGEQKLVLEEIEKNFTPAVVNLQRYKQGRTPAWWMVSTSNGYNNIYIAEPHKPRKDLSGITKRSNKFIFTCYYKKHEKTETKTLSLRRIPKRWIPEYNKLLIRK